MQLVVSYRNSTSNHNIIPYASTELAVVSYRNSTSNHNSAFAIRSATPLYLIEILHQTTTLGHVLLVALQLYLIEILHQTTTTAVESESLSLLYLIEILHQTTTARSPYARLLRCILSKFYIKPQRLM